jgi:bifunctional DNA-binding transcriptional regulator/antitoxin component of YhaV-PrlF toxin-antitoxin module
VIELKRDSYPQKILNQLGIGTGDFLDIAIEGNRIVLTPQHLEDPFTDEEWEKLEKLAKGKGKTFRSGAEFKAHLKKLRS